MKHAIETGALRPGDQLPGIRPLAEELVINPNTVAKAYRELEHEGSSSCATAPGRPSRGTRARKSDRHAARGAGHGRGGGGKTLHLQRARRRFSSRAEIPITVVTITGVQLQLESRVVSGAFTGALGDKGEIAGEWAAHVSGTSRRRFR